MVSRRFGSIGVEWDQKNHMSFVVCGTTSVSVPVPVLVRPIATTVFIRSWSNFHRMCISMVGRSYHKMGPIWPTLGWLAHGNFLVNRIFAIILGRSLWNLARMCVLITCLSYHKMGLIGPTLGWLVKGEFLLNRVFTVILGRSLWNLAKMFVLTICQIYSKVRTLGWLVHTFSL